MPDNVELIVRFHPVGGEDVSILTADFATVDDALMTISRALDEHRSLILSRAKYNREATENAVVVNLSNVVSVRVGRQDTETAGHYL